MSWNDWRNELSTQTTDAAGLQALQHGKALVLYDDLSAIKLSGKDVTDLVQRLTTNDVKKAQPGAIVWNSFPTEKGRLIDVVRLYVDSGLIWLIGSRPTASELGAWIDRMTFREDAEFADESDSYGQFGVCGPQALDVVGALSPDLASLPVGRFARLQVAGAEVLVAHVDSDGSQGFHFVAPWPLAFALAKQMHAAGAIYASPAAREWVRVSEGVPRWGKEITGEQNPHEARLSSLIDWTKGCYVGQEVIARLDTYQKVQRYLTKLELPHLAPEKTPVMFEDGVVGELTSVASCEGAPYVAALSYVKKVAQAATTLKVGDQTATVHPF